MKLRIRGSSIRLRLTRGDLATLDGTGAVAEALHFPGGARFVYTLRRSDAWRADLGSAGLCVDVPAMALSRWLSPDEVALAAELPLPDGGVLRLLVEKDFPCLTTRPGEDDGDAFARPLATTAAPGNAS